MNKKSKNKLKLNSKCWIETFDGKGILGGGRIALLKIIDSEGSIQAAAVKSGISYRKIWGILKNEEDILGFPLLNKQRGGVRGGSSSLTPEAKKLIIAYEKSKKNLEKAISMISIAFEKSINK